MTRYPDAARMFTLDTSTAKMKVVHEDGVHRHLSFRRPDSSMYWYDLITWPGHLCFNGDAGTWVFARVRDMFDFFDGPGDINPGYWAEKVQAGETRRYDPDVARRYVTEAYDEHVREQGLLWRDSRALWGSLLTEVLAYADDEYSFRAVLQNYEFMAPNERNRTEFTFPGTWEWDLRDFTPQFLWACFAIQDGIRRYKGQPPAVQITVNPSRPPDPQVVVIRRPGEQYL